MYVWFSVAIFNKHILCSATLYIWSAIQFIYSAIRYLYSASWNMYSALHIYVKEFNLVNSMLVCKLMKFWSVRFLHLLFCDHVVHCSRDLGKLVIMEIIFSNFRSLFSSHPLLNSIMFDSDLCFDLREIPTMLCAGKNSVKH